MRPSVLVLMLALLTLFASGAQADETYTLIGTATVDGNPGFVLEANEVGFPIEEYHAFVELGQVRISATRPQGATPWDLITPAAYLVPSSTMNVNDTWDFLTVGVADRPAVATVRALESVTVPAGTFNAYRVEIGLASDPSVLDTVIWFADGVGWVRSDYYDVDAQGNPYDGHEELSSYSIVGGSGYFPLAVGNTWSFLTVVPTDNSSWGSVKALYNN